tara:strand:+ start:913 stop:1497 length:585 start_codon:yes stop_codon:yes gene_type:complete
MALTRLGPNQSINLASNVTGALPVANGGTALTSGFVNGGSLTEVDTWRVTTNFNGDAAPITANWERDDTDGNGYIGSGMSQSSGVFTFPSTGYYRVTFYHQFSGMVSGSNSNYVQQEIQYTANNSSYDDATEQWGQIFQNGSYSMTVSSKIFDITDTSNQKVRFSTTSAGNNVYTQCNSGKNMTYATFVKLGAT